MSDLKYIKGFVDGDNAVIADFYTTEKPKFRKYFQKNYSIDDDKADELFQDSCVRMWENISNGKYKVMSCSLETYLYAIGKYTLLAGARKFKEIANDEIFQNYDIADSNPDDIEEKERLSAMADEVVENLDEPCASILRMHYWEKLSGEEIAVALNYGNADSVKTQKYKCMQKVKTAIGKLINF